MRRLGSGRHLISALTPEGPLSGVGSAGSYSSTPFGSANQAQLVPIVLRYPIEVVRLFCVNAATVSGNIDIGIYDAVGRRIVSTGSIAQSGVNSVQSAGVGPIILGPGLFYTALTADNTTGEFEAMQIKAAVWSTAGIGLLLAASAFPLPATVTFAASSFFWILNFGLSAKGVI